MGRRVEALLSSHESAGTYLRVAVDWEEIKLGPGLGVFQFVSWAPDASGVFITTFIAGSWNLLHVTLAGRVDRLQHVRQQWITSPISSPNGKYLAYQAQTWDNA